MKISSNLRAIVVIDQIGKHIIRLREAGGHIYVSDPESIDDVSLARIRKLFEARGARVKPCKEYRVVRVFVICYPQDDPHKLAHDILRDFQYIEAHNRGWL